MACISIHAFVVLLDGGFVMESSNITVEKLNQIYKDMYDSQNECYFDYLKRVKDEDAILREGSGEGIHVKKMSDIIKGLYDVH